MARLENSGVNHPVKKGPTDKSVKKLDRKRPQHGSKTPSTVTKKRKIASDQEGNSQHSSPSNKKRALKQSRQAFRPNSDLVTTAKDLWNQLRLHSNAPEQISSLMTNLMALLQGKFAQVAHKHDASRIIQAALEHANKSQRTIIVEELCAPMASNSPKSTTTDGPKRLKTNQSISHLVELSSSQYAHFIVLKMIKVCAHEPENVRLMVKALKGHILKLAFHSVGVSVVELLFLTFPPKATPLLKLEFYGPLLGGFHTGELSSGTISYTQVTLSSMLKEESESSKQSVLKFFHDRIVQKGIEKKLYSFAFFQQLLDEYISFVPSKTEIRQLSSLISDNCLQLLSTKAGAKVVSECAAYGTPKERKRMIKSLKGYVRSSLLHAEAYIAILRLMDVTDDTVLVQKSILAEITAAPTSSMDKKKQSIAAATVKDDDEDMDESEDPVTQQETVEGNDDMKTESPLLELALSNSGSKVFLLLLAKTDAERKKYFDPMNLEILHNNLTIIEDGQEVATRKKNHDTRRKELLDYLAPSLIELCQTHAGVLLLSKFGSRVILAVYQTWPSETLAYAIVAACDMAIDDSSISSLFEHPFAHLVIKNLLIFESDMDDVIHDEGQEIVERKKYLGLALYQKYKGRLVKTIASTSRGAFVLAALASEKNNVGLDVRKELKKNEKEILARTKVQNETQISTAGYQALVKALT